MGTNSQIKNGGVRGGESIQTEGPHAKTVMLERA